MESEETINKLINHLKDAIRKESQEENEDWKVLFESSQQLINQIHKNERKFVDELKSDYCTVLPRPSNEFCPCPHCKHIDELTLKHLGNINYKVKADSIHNPAVTDNQNKVQKPSSDGSQKTQDIYLSCGKLFKKPYWGNALKCGLIRDSGYCYLCDECLAKKENQK